MSAKEMLDKLGYKLDEKPRFGSIISYTHYCSDGCCRIYDLAFYKNTVCIDELNVSYELLEAINQQVKELEYSE